jgi:hypothetical protein
MNGSGAFKEQLVVRLLDATAGSTRNARQNEPIGLEWSPTYVLSRLQVPQICFKESGCSQQSECSQRTV